MISLEEAKTLCNSGEFTLVENSFPPRIGGLDERTLRSKRTRARSLEARYREQLRKQDRSRKEAGARTDDDNERTSRKAQLFRETRQRFHDALAAAAK